MRDGTVRPYRPKPADFRAAYVEMGWSEIVDHFRTNWRVVVRWIEEEGREELAAARAVRVAEKRRERAAARLGYFERRGQTAVTSSHLAA